MGFMDKIKGKLSSSSSGSGENKRASFVGSSPQAAAAAPSSTQTPAAANPATSAAAAAPAATTTTTAAATTAPATTAPATTAPATTAPATTAPATTAPATTAPATAATTTTPATAASNPATTAGNDTSYQPEPATEANKSTGATPTTSSTNMTSYTGTCHCKHHEWTVELTPDQSKHILCHCDTCKILGGGAYTMNQIIPKSALKITKGGEPGKYTYYGDSGKAVNCYYCPKCTSHIYHHQEVMGPETIIARTALLRDARERFEVGAEIYGKAKMSWEPRIAETFETLPPS